MSHQLCEPITSGGIRTTNFFNGRLLAAEDLQTLQTAERQHRAQLGQAIGSGVVAGLAVTPADPTAAGVTGLHVGSGLAISPSGQALGLAAPIDLAFVQSPASGTAQAGQFADCSTAGPLQATGVGVYLLVLSPAGAFLDNAPMSGLLANGAITGCGARYQVEGVTFRALPFDPTSLPGLPTEVSPTLQQLFARTMIAGATPTDSADLSMLRNRLAHVCLGTDHLSVLPRDPFAQALGQSAFASYGALDALRASGGLGPDDVPLALVYWTRSGIRFVDTWSVRRRPAPTLDMAPWEALVGPRQRSEAEACLLQFQDHLAWLRSTLPHLESVVAINFFRYLPAAGLIPLGPGLRSAGFDLARLTQGLVVRSPAADPVFLDGARVRALLNASLAYPPVDLSVHEMLWLYSLVDNQLAVDTLQAPVPPLSVLFARGQMPFFGTAREDVNRWNYSTYA